MKFLSFLSISAILFFSSCTKTVTNPAPVPTIVGLWVGTLTANNEPGAGPLYYSLDIKSDSTILSQGLGANGNTYYAAGTWSLSGSTFSATITSTTLSNKGVVQNLSATYNQDEGTLSAGTWETVGANAIGTFSLNRIN